MKNLVVGGLVIGGCLVANATTWYATNEPLFEEQYDLNTSACTSWETAGTLSNALSRARSGEASAYNEVVLKSGTAESPRIYDYSSIRGGVSGKDKYGFVADTKLAYAGFGVDYLRIRSEADDPRTVIVLGGGAEQNQRLFNCNNGKGYKTLSGLTLANWYSSAGSPLMAIRYGNNAGTCLMTNCIVSGCYIGTSNSDAGSSLRGGMPFRNCEFIENSGDSASYVVNSAHGCTFVGTTGCKAAVGIGAGTISGCTFISNKVVSVYMSSNALTDKLLVTNCTFAGNSAVSCQAWANANKEGNMSVVKCKFLYNRAGCAKVCSCFNCDFVGNSTSWDSCYNGATTVSKRIYSCEGCVFAGNEGTDNGACVKSAGLCSRCILSNNVSRYVKASNDKVGGGIIIGSNVFDCHFVSNACPQGRAIAGRGTYTRCVFSNNVSAAYGALFGHNGTFRDDGRSIGAYATNCLFTANSDGFAMIQAVNCTVADNAGSAVHGSVDAYNCIFAGNAGTDIPSFTISGFEGGKSYINHCYYQTEEVSHPNTIVTESEKSEKDPFVRKAPVYYGLKKRSEAKDAGCDVCWTANDVDLAGAPRLNGPVDLGCYEWWPRPGGLMLLVR